jgi:hypothetical protein
MFGHRNLFSSQYEKWVHPHKGAGATGVLIKLHQKDIIPEEDPLGYCCQQGGDVSHDYGVVSSLSFLLVNQIVRMLSGSIP